MGKNLPEAGACCLPAADGITYLRVGTRQNVVGMQGLDLVFEQLHAMGRKPETTTDEELVGLARKRNYISRNPKIETDYAAAIRKAYAGYYARHDKAREHVE